MRIGYLSLVAAAALILSAPAHAAEINVLSTNALKTVLEDLSPKFEQSSGDKLAITWGTTAQVKAQIEKGAVFDAAVVSSEVADELIKEGKLASRTPLARSGIAVAIKKGAPKPELRSADDLKKCCCRRNRSPGSSRASAAFILKVCSNASASPTRSRAS